MLRFNVLQRSITITALFFRAGDFAFREE